MSLLSFMLFVGCLGEDPISENSSNKDQESSSQGNSDAASSTEDNSSEEPQDSSSETPDNSSQDTMSSDEEDPDSSSEETTSSVSSTEVSSDDASSSEEETVSSSEEETFTPNDDAAILDDFEGAIAQNVLAPTVAKQYGVSTLDAGGYWYVFYDEEEDEDEMSYVHNSDGEIVDETNFPTLLKDGALHVLLHTSAKISDDDGRFAAVGVNLREEGEPIDMTGLTDVIITAKGTGSVNCSFATSGQPEGWGAFEIILDLTDEFKEETYSIMSFLGSQYSELADEDIRDYMDTMTKFACSLPGGDEAKDAELIIDSIEFAGLKYSDISWK